MKRSLAPLILLGSLPAFSHAGDLAGYQEESRAIAVPFMQRLMAENKKAAAEGGPASAIGVCRDLAPGMASELSRQHGIRLTRISLKTRNPLLGTPDAWEQRQLLEFEARAARGESAEAMEAAEIVEEPAGKSFRYMKAIALQPGCVACHGKTNVLHESVKTRLSGEYPHDRATGYLPGQIRGAVSIKRPL